MADKIKIVHILQTVGIGGMEGRIARLAHGLDPNKYDISIFTLRPTQGRTVPLPEYIHPQLILIPSGVHLKALWMLSQKIRAGNFHIAHTHNWASMFYGVLAAKWAGIPVLIHGEHGLNFGDMAGISPKRLWAQKILASLCNSIVTVNPAMTDSVVRNWKTPSGKITTILNGVDLQRFKPLNDESNLSPEHEFVIGTVGRLDQVKDFPCLIKAFHHLKQKNPDKPMRLVFVGSGPELEKLSARVKNLGLSDFVTFTGDCQEPEKWYPKFSVYVNSSHFEGMSNTLLEAMACGVPLVASDIQGNRSWLTEKENAWFFEPGNDAHLAEVLNGLLENPLQLIEMKKRNRDRAEKEFDNRLFIEKYTALYQRLL